MRLKIKKSNGFSILEVTIALGIITFGLLGVLSLVPQNLQVQSINKNYLIASMLAQEGLELVRNVRDNNFLKGKAFTDGLTGSNPYVINPDLSIKDQSLAKICIKSDAYSHDCIAPATSTIFSRLISYVNKGNYLEVRSNVSWTERGQTYNYEAVTNLYDWW